MNGIPTHYPRPDIAAIGKVLIMCSNLTPLSEVSPLDIPVDYKGITKTLLYGNKEYTLLIHLEYGKLPKIYIKLEDGTTEGYVFLTGMYILGEDEQEAIYRAIYSKHMTSCSYLLRKDLEDTVCKYDKLINKELLELI